MGKALALVMAISLLAACGGGGSTQPPPPPPMGSLSYPSGLQSFVIGAAITPVTPTITGTLSSFSASPALPSGLALDPNKGTISGTPTAITASATYTISASVSGGTTTSANISIAVNDVPPTNVSYASASFSFSAGVTSSILTPTAHGGAVVSWSIDPALPAGLNFNTTDGSISGKPSAPSAATSYSVKAQNSGGQSVVTLTIAVGPAPLLNVGHSTALGMIRETATNVLSIDVAGHWVLWDYARAAILADGDSGCESYLSCTLVPAIELAGSTAAIATLTGFDVHATSDGHTLGTIATTFNWWKLATDGSYIVAGNPTGLSVWSTAGQLLFSRPGDYSGAAGFALPGGVLVAAGPVRNVIETVSVPSGTSITSPPFNGTFSSWFVDGGHFISLAGSTALIYSFDGTQQGSITPLPANARIVGQGNWVWTTASPPAINIYPATQPNATPTATFAVNSLATLYASGMTVGVVTSDSTAVSVIDLSGTVPTKTDYTAPLPLDGPPNQLNFGTYTGPFAGPYAAASASRWLVAGGDVLFDGPTLGSTVRDFGLGQVLSIAGGTGHFAVATASGTIVYFNSNTLAEEGRIAFPAQKVALSADGSLLVAQGNQRYGVGSLEVYSLPSGSLLYTWPYTLPTSGNSTGWVSVTDIELSDSGTVLGQIFSTPTSATLQASSPTGGPLIFSSPASPSPSSYPERMRLSPDGTLIVTSELPANQSPPWSFGATLFHNGNLVTAFTGYAVGWLDNNRLLVDNYRFDLHGFEIYSGCSIFGADGNPTAGACALPHELSEFQAVTSDSIYAPRYNQIFSVSGGTVGWASGEPIVYRGPYTAPGAIAGSQVVFASGSYVLAQPY